jgi:hypothetical protein
MRKSLLVVVSVVVAVWPAAAVAASRDAVSDHTAFGAYQRFLAAMVSAAGEERSAGDAFIATISAGCPNVLAALNVVPASQINRAALTAFAGEVGTDLELSALRSLRRPLSRMTAVLSGLRWSAARTSVQIKRYTSTVRAYFTLAPSDLCADARALASSNAQTAPTGTLQWLAGYGQASARLNTASSLLVGILTRFATPSDLPAMHAIERLLRRLPASQEAVLNAEVPKLFAALGITTTSS